MKPVTLTVEIARQRWFYIPDTGELIDNETGSLARTSDNGGYRSIYYGGRGYMLHRVIWLMQTGEWPNIIDHINRKRSDNRWANLREADPAGNSRNRGPRNRSKSMKGAFMSGAGIWRARLQHDDGYTLLGPFNTEAEAAAAYDKYVRILHGAFACTNEDLGLLPKQGEAA